MIVLAFKRQWTYQENVKIAGRIDRYRDMINKGVKDDIAARKIATDILMEDPAGVYVDRTSRENTSNPEKTIADHIKYLDKVLSGEIEENKLHGNDYDWFNKWPR